MKKRILFSACALAACFVACTNDDFQTEKSNMVIDEAGEVIGADLVSSGMKMNVSTGDATTRLNGNGWEAADEVGLAWYRYKAAIDKEQLRSDWENGSGWATDNNLYANHLFEFQSNGIWETHADVYQGAYFCYWPFERLGSASKIKVVEPNKAAQTKDFDEDRLENAFWLSAQDFIEQLDVQDLVLQKDFVLAPMVNTLGVNAIPAGKLTESEYLKGMIIKEMRINAGGTNNDVFIPSATLTPRYIPKAVYDMYGNLNKEETLVDLDEQATGNYDRSTKWYLTTTGVTNLTYLRTAIDNSDFNLNKTNTLRAFAFPLQKGVTYAQYQYPSVSIDVWSQVGEWKLGTFNISHSQEENAQLTERLKMMFEANPTNAAATWVKNIWGEPGEYQYAVEGMDASLTVHNFTPSTTILYGVDQWNDLVQLIDELDKAGKKFTNNKVTFTVASTNGVTFTNEIRTPENVQIVLKTGDNKICIDGVVEWPKNLITDEETANIEVNKGATLKVGIDRDEEVNLVANGRRRGFHLYGRHFEGLGEQAGQQQRYSHR